MLVQAPHSGVLPVQRPSENAERKVATVGEFDACAVQTNNSLCGEEDLLFRDILCV